MARHRTFKSEYWTSEQVIECDPITRLLFLGMWNFCDDGGVIKNSTKQLKVKILPGDAFSPEDIQRMLDELEANDLIHFFEVGKTSYIKVIGWDHQKIDRPTFKLPQPNGQIPKDKQHYQQIHADFIRRLNCEDSHPNKSRVEENKNKSGVEDEDDTSSSNANQFPNIQKETGVQHQPLDTNHPVVNFKPAELTLQQLKTYHPKIPNEFIEECIAGFVLYWAGREPIGNYDSAFFKDVPYKWKKFGATWLDDRDNPNSEPQSVSDYIAEQESAGGSGNVFDMAPLTEEDKAC